MNTTIAGMNHDKERGNYEIIADDKVGSHEITNAPRDTTLVDQPQI